MQDPLKDVCVWIHLLCMVGAFGALLYHQIGLDQKQKSDPDLGRSVNKIASLFITVGFLLGLFTYVLVIKSAGTSGTPLDPSVHMKIGIKFLLLLGAGACLGISSGMIRKERFSIASTQRTIALVLLAMAALIGVWL